MICNLVVRFEQLTNAKQISQRQMLKFRVKAQTEN